MQKPQLWFLLGLAIAFLAVVLVLRARHPADTFTTLMTRGQGYLEKGDSTNAIAAYSKAVSLAPESIDAHLDLAIAYLLAGHNQEVVAKCQQALNLDHNSAAAYYLMGCAYLHLNQPEQAIQAFQD